jgi:NADPH2:quinone reductase
MQNMKAIRFFEYGSYDQLKLVDIPMPVLQAGQLLVKVTLAAVNPVDNTIRSGGIPQAPKPPMIPGNEGAGFVVKGNSEFPEGTRIIISGFTPQGVIRGIRTDGTWQEYLALYPEELVKTPGTISDEEAAAANIGFFSAQACLNKAGFAPGKSVLSLGVGGAVGNAGVQLAKAQGAPLVITTAGSAAKVKAAEEAGFENIINMEKETISQGVKRLTDGKGVDIAIDSIGGALTGEAVSALARNGVIVNIGYSAGTQVSINITDFVWKGLQMRGVSLSGWFSSNEQQNVWNQILPLLDNGRIKPGIAKVFDIADAPEAQRYLIEDRPFGKVLLRI